MEQRGVILTKYLSMFFIHRIQIPALELHCNNIIEFSSTIRIEQENDSTQAEQSHSSRQDAKD